MWGGRALCATLLLPCVATAQSSGFTEADREMLRSLDKRVTVLEATLKEFKEAVDKRFEQVDKRFEQVDKRFEQVDKRLEQVDKRFEQVDKRIDDVTSFLAILAGIFTAMTVATIGLAIWDRRTTLGPIERRVADMSSLSQEDRKTVEALQKEVARLSVAYEEMKALLGKAG